ncbi:hypothetical protein J2T58_000837 [Methanocalculus alkaliphilus]|uniref:hypothetical protein n=1 Tax=Methanocalculus alkaliphilus TaxID=768730 RepID=UPI00209F8E06|nr:hypothetical protein [Methanocalculus alkaliphilus]MCP1714989.1 hypothetical protein [Methanocalculus alkaliphilus]
MSWRSILFLLCLLCLSSGCFQPDSIPPSITPLSTDTTVHPISHSFLFEESRVTIDVPVDMGVYRGAQQSNKRIYLYRDLPDSEWYPIYYTAFIDDPHQDPFFQDLISALRSVRSDLRLDDDRYLELCSVFVQSLPYDDDTVLIEPKFPIETYGDGTGDCDDKSLLLAGILSREGYDVALLLYLEEKHMAIGIRGDGCSDVGDGYSYLETTRAHFVGIVPDRLAGNVTISSTPIIIPVGDGTLGYGACLETRALFDLLSYCRDQVDELNAQMDRERVVLEGMKEEIAARQSSMELLRSQGRYTEYNHQVAGFNAEIERYNDRLRRYNELVREAERYVGIHTTILDRMYDRHGLYRQMERIGILAEMRGR